MFSPELLEKVLIVAFLILSLGIHEAAHAWVANLCGDSTAKNLGRMTLNPIVHIDLFMTILLPAILLLSGSGFLFGGAKPVPVNPHNLRKPLRDMMFVAIAGPLSNVILAVVFMFIFRILVFQVGMDSNALAPKVMYASMYVNLILAIFNMLPVPPLDGSRVMAYVLPSSLREQFVSLERFGMIIVFALLFSGVLTTVLRATILPMVRFVQILAGGI
ncbi:MAG: site-2 protease family protein [bacterium]|nr:site-2 protease family protein [bacterium]